MFILRKFSKNENLGISKTVLLFRVLLKFCRFCPVPGIVSFRRILSQTKKKRKPKNGSKKRGPKREKVEPKETVLREF